MISEREKVMIQREAYESALYDTSLRTTDSIKRQAAEKYPMPKVSRRREITLTDGVRYRVRADGKGLEYRSEFGLSWNSTDRTRADFRNVASLFDNPDELVDVE